MSAAWTATEQDWLMLQKALPRHQHIDFDALPERTGAEVANELAGRALLRYLDVNTMHETGRSEATFVTPTPLAPEDLVPYLALPRGDLPRTYAVWLDPSQIAAVKGPRWVVGGQGIEYLLPFGYPETAMLEPRWAVAIR